MSTAFLTRQEREVVIRALEVYERGATIGAGGSVSVPLTGCAVTEDQRRARRILENWHLGDTFGLVRQAIRHHCGPSWEPTHDAIREQDAANSRAVRRENRRRSTTAREFQAWERAQ